MIGFALILILLLAVIVFSVQNAGVVALSFFFWKFQASLSILVIAFFIAGVLSTILVYLMGKIRPRAAAKTPGHGGDIPPDKMEAKNGRSKKQGE
jgi:uncharacterized integral membrane protein